MKFKINDQLLVRDLLIDFGQMSFSSGSFVKRFQNI